MYPSLETNLTQTTFKKTLAPSEQMTNAVLELRQTMPSISSFKPHLNTHECHLSMVINNKMSLPIKIVFLRNYPHEKPLIFVAQLIRHPLINPSSCKIEYETQFPWYPNTKLSELLKRIQGKFAQVPPSYETELDKIVSQLDTYGRQVESLRTKPVGTQPPPIPQFNLESTLKTFEYQQNLYKECEEKNDLYMITAAEYNQNLARVRVVSEKFSKGKIIRELEKQIESEIEGNHGGRIQDVLQGYFNNRKKLHKLKILKELYIQS